MRDRTVRVAFAACLAACGASGPVRSVVVPMIELRGTDGRTHALPSHRAALTVLVFFSAHCDCQAAHDARLRELERRYAPRRVAFFAIDSEGRAALDRDADEARRRRYRYPILIDEGAGLARKLGAEYATYAVVLDSEGRVRYRGGIDSDQVHLREDAKTHLRDALDDLLAGREPRVADGEALGCALEID